MYSNSIIGINHYFMGRNSLLSRTLNDLLNYIVFLTNILVETKLDSSIKKNSIVLI